LRKNVWEAKISKQYLLHTKLENLLFWWARKWPLRLALKPNQFKVMTVSKTDQKTNKSGEDLFLSRPFTTESDANYKRT
jgi:hypothetical protein